MYLPVQIASIVVDLVQQAVEKTNSKRKLRNDNKFYFQMR